MCSARRSLRLFLSCAAMVLAASAAQAQVCEGSFVLKTQAEVDAFDCTEVTGDLYVGPIFNDSGITSLAALEGLTDVGGSLWIGRNDALTSLAGLESLTSVGGGLSIDENRTLTSLVALKGLTSIDGGLGINNNGALTNLTGLEGLTSVGGLSIVWNGALTSLTGLEGLTSVGDNIWIAWNYALTSLAGLTSPARLGGYLGIVGNIALTSLDGLGVLTGVDGYLVIQDNHALTSLAGLEGLASVGGYLQISHNNALTNIDGLVSLTSVGSDLRVYNNSALSECTVGLAPLLLEGEVGNQIVIRDNAPGCNSIEEVLAGVDAEDGATPLVTGLAAPYPNPTAGAATVAFTLAEPGDLRLTVYDALGRRVAVLAEGPHAAGVYEVAVGAGLPAGAYVVRLEAGGQAFDERVTVVR